MRPSTNKAATTTLTSEFRSQIDDLREMFYGYEKAQIHTIYTARMELLWRMFNTKQNIGLQIKEEED
jgi:hypothetical protein